MSSSGHAHARAGSIMSTHGGEGAECVRRQKNQWFSGSSGSGCRPDRRCWKTPSKGESGIRLGMRRGDLRIRHNHANPPRFERQRAPYKCIVALLQYIWAGNGMLWPSFFLDHGHPGACARAGPGRPAPLRRGRAATAGMRICQMIWINSAIPSSRLLLQPLMLHLRFAPIDFVGLRSAWQAPDKRSPLDP